MFEFHQDKARYFDMQYRVTVDYILPFLREKAPDKTWGRVLEIGCAEAGVLKAFLEEGAFCTGVELSESRVELATAFHREAVEQGRIEFVNRNIFDIDPENDLGGRYDLVILKDVIEHVPGQLEFMAQLSLFLEPDGLVFFAFPPWMMPFGGHQQVCRSKLSRLPFIHLLPSTVYKRLLLASGERPGIVEELMEIKRTGITIERFERYLRVNHLKIQGQAHFFINPIYQYKFGWRPRVVWPWLRRIPWLRNFYTTGVYYLVGPR